MREFIHLAESLNETPIDDLRVIGEPQPYRNGEWNGTHKLGRNGFGPGDQVLLTNPKSVKKIRDAFEKTPFVFDFYIFLDGDSKERPVLWTKAKLEKALGEPINNSGKISIVYTNNITNTAPGSYMPMNSWALAHRMCHDFQFHSRESSRNNPAEQCAWRYIWSIWNLAYGKTLGEVTNTEFRVLDYSRGPGSEHIIPFINMLFTMRSARNGKLRNDLDVFPELHAQFLLTGRVRFNRVAEWDAVRMVRDRGWFMPPVEKFVIPEERHAEIDALIERAEAEIGEEITRLLQSMVGGVYGW